MAKAYNKKLIIIAVLVIIIFAIAVGIIFKSLTKKSTYYAVNFKQIESWRQDGNLTSFVKAFKGSCRVFNKKNPATIITTTPATTTVKDWQNICAKLNSTSFKNNHQIYQFIENNLKAYLVKGQQEARITGYYRMELVGSLKKTKTFKYPIYKLPKDLITANLGNFSPDLNGKTIYGRVKQNQLIPYYTREEINKGALDKKGLEVVWLNNKYSAFLLHVQGSGLIKLKENNKEIYLSYAGRNGYPFKGIYNYLKEKNYLKNTATTGMTAVYDFFAKNPDKIDEVLNQNPSYIFFKEVNKNMWHAAFGSNPVVESTIAVDPSFEPLGAPLLLVMKDPATNNSMVRLVVANDTGSAIKGPARVDFYWGLGQKAGTKAALTNQKGTLYLFLPKVKS